MPEIALFGGSFDPPHVGHLLAAAYVLATEPVDELWFVPVLQHPLGKPLLASFEHRVLEYVDHLHELFLSPVIIRDGRYMPPAAPGYSITMRSEVFPAYTFPAGSVWND